MLPSTSSHTRAAAHLAWLLGLLVSLWPEKASADWSLNVAYQNPVPATIGVNGQYLWQNIAFDVGLGYTSVAVEVEEGKRKPTITLHGGTGLKYLFLDGWFRPYVDGGVTIENQYYLGRETGVTFGSGPFYMGGGTLLGSKEYYGYLAAQYWQGQIYFQAGLGHTF